MPWSYSLTSAAHRRRTLSGVKSGRPHHWHHPSLASCCGGPCRVTVSCLAAPGTVVVCPSRSPGALARTQQGRACPGPGRGRPLGGACQGTGDRCHWLGRGSPRPHHAGAGRAALPGPHAARRLRGGPAFRPSHAVAGTSTMLATRLRVGTGAFARDSDAPQLNRRSPLEPCISTGTWLRPCRACTRRDWEPTSLSRFLVG